MKLEPGKLLVYKYKNVQTKNVDIIMLIAVTDRFSKKIWTTYNILKEEIEHYYESTLNDCFKKP